MKLFLYKVDKIRMNKKLMLDINFEYGNEIQTINPVLLIDKNDVVLVGCGYPNFSTLLEMK